MINDGEVSESGKGDTRRVAKLMVLSLGERKKSLLRGSKEKQEREVGHGAQRLNPQPENRGLTERQCKEQRRIKFYEKRGTTLYANRSEKKPLRECDIDKGSTEGTRDSSMTGGV